MMTKRNPTLNALVPVRAASVPAVVNAPEAPFAFQGQQVRHVLIDGDPWFVAADACRCLFSRFDPVVGVTHWLQALADDEKRIAKAKDDLTREIFEGHAMTRTLTLISESGLYKVALRAQRSNPLARTFQDWVTREVLPAIRKTGGYLINEAARETAAVDPRMPTSMADALRRYADEVEKREEAEKGRRSLSPPGGHAVAY